MLALLDDAGVRWRDVLDLARGLAIERTRALFEPGDHPLAMSLLAGAAVWLVSLAISFAVPGIGWGARNWLGPPPGPATKVAMALYAAGLIGWCIRSIMWTRRYRATVVPPAMPARAVAPWIAAVSVALVLKGWAGAATLPYCLMAASMLASAAGWRGRWRHVYAATLQLSSCRHEMKWALLELDRCEHLAAQGLPAPVDAARENVMRLRHVQAETIASLHAMGYRARFR